MNGDYCIVKPQLNRIVFENVYRDTLTLLEFKYHLVQYSNDKGFWYINVL